jgi:hypothetical protein
VFIVYLVLTKAIAAMRFDLDQTAQAMKIQALIDQRVADRIAVIQVPTRPGGRSARLPEQPVDPNVKFSGTVDDIHERERELNRIIGDADFTTRDDFRDFSQPPLVEP